MSTAVNDDDRKERGPSHGSILAHPDTFAIAVILALLLALLVPGAWLGTIPLAFGYALWMKTRRHRLPFRLPMGWKGPDYSNPIPGSRDKFRAGEGLLFLGNDHASNEEVWISNSDARRHALVLGTTGAGKALPVDSLVLTPDGWTPIGELRCGDPVMHPTGKFVKVMGNYPQGMLPVVRLEFADGRFAECSRDHVWRVCIRTEAQDGGTSRQVRTELMTAADLGVLLGLNEMAVPDLPAVRAYVKLPCPMPAVPDPGGSRPVDLEDGNAFRLNPGVVSKMLASTPRVRRDWIGRLIARVAKADEVFWHGSWMEVPVATSSQGFMLRNLVWSLGGAAVQIHRNDRIGIRATFPMQETVIAGAPSCGDDLAEFGLEIVGATGFLGGDEAFAERGRIRGAGHSDSIRDADVGRTLSDTEPLVRSMTCIRTDADDGMFVMEGYLPTHNTELLLGMASQSMIWSSGFMYIDGKGTAEFHGKAWSIVSRFGRQDDYRILNFTDGGSDPDEPAGGPDVQSNTLNPFSHGTADQLMNLVVSLMGASGREGDLWKLRAMSLVTSTMKALCEMRDAGDVLLDVQSIRDHLPLGIGVKKELLEGRTIADVSEVPERAWTELRSRGGMVELYLRALDGEFSDRSRLALKGFFDSLPGFRLELALNGEPQQGKAAEQYGFLSMQLTKPLGSLADDFGHIFRTPFGEVDIKDVVLNRRILLVLLPALQKAPEEMRNCGRIVVSMLKMMMGEVAGSRLEGQKASLVDARPTRSPTPFIAILDEAGYYMVKGIDTMMAQARSLGFMIVIAGQDMASMQSVSSQVAETAAANARLTIAGATEDAHRTWEFLRKKFARHRVATSSGRSPTGGLLSRGWVDRPDQVFVEQERVPIGDLQKLREGEFHVLMESRLARIGAYHLSEEWVPWLALNKFLAVRSPTDRVRGTIAMQSADFLDALRAAGHSLLVPEEMDRRSAPYPHDPKDTLHCAVAVCEQVVAKCSDQDDEDKIREFAPLLGLVHGSALARLHGVVR